MDPRSSELNEPDPSSSLCLTSECEEPDTGESDISPPCKRKNVASQRSSNFVSPASSSVCSPDSESDSEGELHTHCEASTSNYYRNLLNDLECQPLEESFEDHEDDADPVRVQSTNAIDLTGKLTITTVLFS